MFDLELVIGNWRERLRADGIIDREAVEELESHLRDAIEAKISAGVEPELAFYKSIAEIGEAKVLKEEFRSALPYSPKRAQIVKTMAVLLIVASGILTANLFSPADARKVFAVSAALILFGIFLAKYLAFVRWKSAEPDFSNFSQSALSAIELARAEAPKFHHDFIGTEHLLLGICGEIPELLTGLGLKREKIREEIEKLVGLGPDHKTNSVPPFTPRAKHAMGLAAGEAKGLGHARIEPEHLFLGLLLEPDGVGTRVLHGLGVDFEAARKRVNECLRSKGE
jgi:hypothetical protein